MSSNPKNIYSQRFLDWLSLIFPVKRLQDLRAPFWFNYLLIILESWQLNNYLSCVIFDTAPTGHTLRLLNFPGTVESGIGKVLGMFDGGGSLGPIMNMAKSVMGVDLNADFITDKLGDILPTVRKMKAEFEDPELTTFVCVCIAEFLSLYETERLIQVILISITYFLLKICHLSQISLFK